MTQIPLTPATIKTVEQHAHADGVRGLKIRTSHRDLLWDSSWTAGVECEEDAWHSSNSIISVLSKTQSNQSNQQAAKKSANKKQKKRKIQFEADKESSDEEQGHFLNKMKNPNKCG